MAPADMASATSALTAPTRAISSAGTLSSSVFASLEYVTKPRSTTLDEPGISVSAPAIRPPVQDSAVASLYPAASKRARTSRACSRTSSGNMRRFLPLAPKRKSLLGRQADRGDSLRRDAFAASGEAQPLRRRRLHADPAGRHVQQFSHPGHHRLPVRSNL